MSSVLRVVRVLSALAGSFDDGSGAERALAHNGSTGRSSGPTSEAWTVRT